MATATKQLEAIYQEISQQFSGDNRITITPLDGDPPEKYEITYRITGIYKDESGDIQESNNHTITISIPFGFPHFPPSCKPKTPIFHPDFDPAAISIGDFWEKDCTISDLVLHIGDMISGRHYSIENAFNEEAAVWYREHKSRLPFDDTLESENEDLDAFDLTPSDQDDVMSLLEDDSAQEDYPDLSIEPSDDHEEPLSIDASAAENGVDTLDESFLETDFDYLSPDDKDLETEEVVPPVPEPDEAETHPGFDSDKLKLLARQKRFFQLDTELDSLPGDSGFPEQATLKQRAAEALQQARELYNQGTEFEHQGNPGRALNIFKQVEATVSDYPGLDEDIERTTQAKELLGDWEEPTQEAPADDWESEDLSDEAEAPELPEQHPGEAEKAGYRTFFEETAQQTSRLLPFAAGGAVCFIIAVAAVFYFLNSSRLDAARQKFTDCRTSLEQNRFNQAERQCEIARDLADRVGFFKGGARDELKQEIDDLLRSQVLREGLMGNLLYEGQFLPEAVVKANQSFKRFMEEGERHLSAENWEQAASNFKQALQISNTEKGIAPELVFKTAENLTFAQFKSYYRTGNEFIEREKWVLADQNLQKALELAKGSSIENKAEAIAAITAKLAEIALVTSIERGDVAFSEQRWGDALTHYRQAYDLSEESSLDHAKGISSEELKQLLVKAELYNTINTGKEAFKKAQWDKAIEQYGMAITLLENNQDLLRQTNTEGNRKKLAHVMLQASIIRDKQAAAKYLKSEQFRQALSHLRSIIETISASEFASEPEFTRVVEETKQAIEQANQELQLAGKRDYLRENFTELFTRHYQASSPESLTDQRVIFDEQIGDKLIFRLECIEVVPGRRPLRLVMKYAYDLRTGRWGFHSGTN